MKVSKIGNKGTKTGEPAIVSVLLYIHTALLSAQQYNHQICNLNKGDK